VAEVEEHPVLLQWFPQDALGSGSWNRGTPTRTRSLSPVPSSHQSARELNGMEATPSFAPPPEAEPVEGPRIVQRPAKAAAGPTLRPAQNFEGMRKTASQSGFKGVDGIVQWFNLATPRPGFVPGELTRSVPNRQPQEPSMEGNPPAVSRS
jgi:hypothetical protein